jgi:hypothetical protein
MSSDKELSYRLPPDVLHYEPKYFFGLGLQELMIAVMPSMLVMQFGGVGWGAITGILMLLGLRRWEAFGNRSVLLYLALLLWYRYRPGELSIPRVLPLHPSRVEVANWEGHTLFVLEGEGQ